jgi:hypothetical protein
VALGCKFGSGGGAPSLTNDAGTDCPQRGSHIVHGVQSGFYWSSSANEDTPGSAWLVSLRFGSVNFVLKVGVFFVWPV